MNRSLEKSIRIGVCKMLVDRGVEHNRAWSEVGYMLNRWPPETVSSAVIASIGADDPLAEALERIQYGIAA